MQETTTIQRVSLSIDEAAAALSIGRATLYELLASGDGPPTYRVGTRRLVPVASLQIWAANRALAESQADEKLSPTTSVVVINTAEAE